MTQQPDTNPALVPEWTLGWRLQRALAHAGITSNDIADEMEVSRTTISRWLNDRGAPPRSPYVKQWALICRVPYDWLVYGDNGPTSPGPGTSAQFKGLQVNVPKNINPWSQWGSPTPLTLAVAA